MTPKQLEHLRYLACKAQAAQQAAEVARGIAEACINEIAQITELWGTRAETT